VLTKSMAVMLKDYSETKEFLSNAVCYSDNAII
jgi:hypothetical protein